MSTFPSTPPPPKEDPRFDDWVFLLWKYARETESVSDGHIAEEETAHGGIVADDDSRLTDARTPTPHASTHNVGGTDVLAIDSAAATGSLRTLGTTATSACAGNDSRLSDARAPTAHATTHAHGGADILTAVSIGAKPQTGFLNRTSSTLSMSGSTFQVTTGSSFDIYSGGTKYTKNSTQSVNISNDLTLHYVYFDTSGTIQVATSSWDITSDNIPCAVVYKDGSNYIIGEERHSCYRDKHLHAMLHSTVGARYDLLYGGLAGTFTNTTLSISRGRTWDEDIVNDTGGTQTTCSIWFRNTGATAMRVELGSTTPYRTNLGVIQYDNAGTMTNVASGRYVNSYVYATNDITTPIAVVIGQGQYTTPTLARAESLPNIPLSTLEWKLIYRVMYRNAAGTPTYEEAADFRTTSSLPTGAVPATNASSVTFIPTTGISATNVQEAVEELESETLKSAGLAGGQTLNGGTAASESLTLSSTADATKGAIIVNAPADAQATAVLGAELLTNASFASDLSSWTAGAGWAYASGGAQHTAGNTATLTQAVTVTAGNTYQITVTISGRTAGTVAIALGAVSLVTSGTSTDFSTTSTRTLIAGASGSVTLTITPTSTFDGKLDSVSVKLLTLESFPATVGFYEGGAEYIGIRQSALRNLTAFGYKAGATVTSGTNNVFIGVNSGRISATGNGNCSFGANTFYSLTTGGSNIAIGQNAGYSMTTPNNNTLIGSNAGYSLTTGATNTFFGNNAGYNDTTGLSSLCLGHNSGRYLADGSSPATSFDNCVYVGPFARVSANGVTNENVFGHTAIGIGSNTTVIGASTNTKTQIYGDIVFDKTITATGTNGAQTINKTCGSVNFAAAATSLVVTNSLVTTSSVIIATVATNDTTMKSVAVVAAAGSFTIYANAAATAATRVNFLVIN